MKDISKPKRRVIICPPLEANIRRVKSQFKGGDFRWVYLGENVAVAIAVERQLQGKGHRLETAEELQKIAQSLRQPYIDYIGKLSLENHSIWWWIGSVSEKNPWASKTFLYACYIRLCQKLLTSGDGEPLVLFIESRALRKCLVRNISAYSEWEISHLESLIPTVVSTVKRAWATALYKNYFLLNSIYRSLLARYYGLNRVPVGKKEGKGLVLLHTWVDQRSFDASGRYHESYFGNLACHLRNKRENVVIVPYILRTVSYRQVLKKMAQSHESFLVPESFIRIGDVFRTLAKTVASTPTKSAYPGFEGMEISELLYDDQRREWRGIRTALSLLHYQVVRHWKDAGIPVEAFIYTYENHVWEKAYCMALRQFYPAARITGYQHATVPKMVLNYFFSREEAPLLPFPDKVITNGRYVERLFRVSGYPPEKVVCGGAIRYEDMRKRGTGVAVNKDASPPVILVTPSIDGNETIELVWKVREAFGQMDKYQIILKFHPVVPYSSIARAIGRLPENFVVSDKPVSDLLEESQVLLYTSSATSIEALSCGVPALHIKSDFIVDRDDLYDFSSSIRRSAKNKDEIVTMTGEILDTGEEELSKQRAMWEDMVSDMFGPVDESVFDLFL